MDSLLAFLNLTPNEVFGVLIGVPTLFVYWRILDALFIQKFFALVVAREQITSDVHEASQKIIDEALTYEERAKVAFDKARIEALRDKASKIQEAQETALKTVHQAEMEAQKLVHDTRKALDEEYKFARVSAERNSDQLARELTDKIKSSSIIFIISLITCNTAFSETAHHEAHIEDLFPYVINFLLYIGVMYYFLKEPLVTGWAKRKDRISSEVKKGKLERESALQRLENAKNTDENLSRNIERLKDYIAKDAKTEATDILKDAHDRALRIRDQGRSMAEAEGTALRRKYKKELASSVVRKAKNFLEKEITAEIDTNLRKVSANSFKQLVQ